MRTWLLALVLLLSGCGVQSLPGVFTAGDIRILGLEPDVRFCAVERGMWIAVLGENLGSPERWASGDNEAIFAPRPPGIPAEEIEMDQGVLYLHIPDGAQTGSLILHAGPQGLAEIPLVFDDSLASNGFGPAQATCLSNPPPP